MKNKGVSAAQMRELDRKAAEVYGIPALLLMENAGRGVAQLIPQQNIVIFCGPGNNGGDGFVAARHLANRGCKVRVVVIADPSAYKGDAALNLAILQKMQVPVHRYAAGQPPAPLFAGAQVIIDALFGVGLNKPLTGAAAECVNAINASGLPVLAVDLPSGLDADSGRILGAAVHARVTATLGLPKKGLFCGDGPACAGDIKVVDIGLPGALTAPLT